MLCGVNCVQEIMWFFVQMLLSLQHVHSKQILHRDLKTQNILLDKKKKAVKVGDFGISKVLLSKSKAYTVAFVLRLMTHVTVREVLSRSLAGFPLVFST